LGDVIYSDYSYITSIKLSNGFHTKTHKLKNEANTYNKTAIQLA